MSQRGVDYSKLKIRQKTAHEVTVMVWKTSPGRLGGLTGRAGHAALLLRRDMDEGPWGIIDDGRNAVPDPNYDITRARYVSFWPGGSPGKGLKGLLEARAAEFQGHHLVDYVLELGGSAATALSAPGGVPRPGQIVIGQQVNGDDVWGQAPDAFVNLWSLALGRPRQLGLSLPDIIEWALRFKASEDFNYTYVSKSNNCAGIATRALAAGGADAFARLGHASAKASIYLTPNDALSYAEGVERGIAAANFALWRIASTAVGYSLPPGFNLPAGNDLPSPGDWKKTSKVEWSVRDKRTRAVDDGLEAYHAVDWDTGFAAKLEAFVRVLEGVAEEFFPGRSSERLPAYIALGKRIVNVATQLSVRGGRAWSPNLFYGR